MVFRAMGNGADVWLVDAESETEGNVDRSFALVLLRDAQLYNLHYATDLANLQTTQCLPLF